MLIVYTDDCDAAVAISVLEDDDVIPGKIYAITQTKLEALSSEWDAAEDLPQKLLFVTKGTYAGLQMEIIQRDEFTTAYADARQTVGLLVVHPVAKPRRDHFVWKPGDITFIKSKNKKEG